MKRLYLWFCLLLLLPALAQAQSQTRGNAIWRTYANDTTTGTTQYMLAKIVSGTGSEGKAIKAGTGDTAIPLALVSRNGAATPGGTSTTGNATLIWVGEAPCTFDAANASGVAGQPVLASTTSAGKCHTQVSPPANGFVVGYMISDSTSTAAGATSQVMFGSVPFVPGTAGSSSISSGLANHVAYYPADGTTVDDLAALPTNNRALIGNGTTWVTMSVDTAGAGDCSSSTVVTGTVANATPNCNPVTSARVNNTVAITGVDINTSSQVTKASTSFALAGTLTPTALTGTVNDYNPANFATSSKIRLDGGAADRNITGFAAQADGDIKEICNVGTTNALVLKDENTGSSATNRLALTDDVTINPKLCAAIQYDNTTQRWRLFVGTMPDYMKVRTFSVCTGDTSANAGVLASDSDSPNGFINMYGRNLKILGVSAWCDAGATTFRPILRGGAANSILSADCTCGTSTLPAACTLQGTPIINTAARGTAGATCSTTPCAVDLNIATADGTSRYGCVNVEAIFTP